MGWGDWKFLVDFFLSFSFHSSVTEIPIFVALLLRSPIKQAAINSTIFSTNNHPDKDENHQAYCHQSCRNR